MSSEPEPPVRILGRYAICGTIGVGGMATVHVGRLLGPVGFSRTVAIKRMHPQFAKDPEFVTMFLDEARIAARVQHANVVSTLDVVTEEGELFHVMEYVEGEPLSKILTALERSRARLPLPVLGSIVSQALHGLHAVHEARGEDGRPLGLIHRDVSPDNVLVGRDGSARVLDFGIAKATELGRRTQAGKIKGKVAYMSPEHLRGKDLDRRADLFSAGAVLWEGLTGARLVPGTSDIEMVHNAISFRPRPPSSVVPSLSPEIDGLVMRALSLDPGPRFSTAREMAIAIEQALGVASPTTVGEVVETTMGRELAKKAAIVDSAVKLAARIGSDPARGRPVSDPASSSPVSAKAPSGPFQPAASRPAELQAAPPPSIETFSRRGTELMPGGPPPPVSTPTREGFARLGSSATELMPNRPRASAPASLELPPLEEQRALSPSSKQLPTMIDPAAGPRTTPMAPRVAPLPAPPEHRVTTPSGGFYLVRGSPREDPPSPSRRGSGELDVDFGAARAQHQELPRGAPYPPANAPRPYGPAAAGPGFVTPGAGATAPRSSAAIVLPVVLAVSVLGLLAFLVLRTGSRDDKSPSSAAAPPTPEEVAACETLRRHVRSGGQATGMSKAGWALELWLRAPKGDRIESGSIDVADLVGDAKGTTVEVVTLNAPGKTADEGTVVRLRGEGAERAFDKDAVPRLIAASDRIFEKTRAEAGGLYLKCAHLPYHDVGLWFRGKDSSTASSALLFSVGLFGDPDVVRDEALETADVVERPSMFERITLKLGPGAGKPLEEELTKYNATIDRPAAGGVRITFATSNLGSAIRASRIVADHAGVEQL